MFKNVFRSKPKKQQQTGPSPSEAISKLRGVEDMLSKKTEYLEKKIQNELEIIKKNGTKNKKVSMAALKRKKRFEAQLQQIDGTLTTLETQRISLENANTNVEVLRTMKMSADALKMAQMRVGDVDSVADIMDDIREQQELAQEISDIISNPVGFGQGVEDDDDLLRELEDLEQQDLDEQLLNTDTLPTVPSVQPVANPRNKTKQKAVEEDHDLEELAQWAV